jgi:hypothetical protein
VNLTPGSVGHGSERGLGSLMQLISDNEGTATSFFRPNTVRGVIFVADEDDQTFTIDDPAPADLSPNDNYMCDQASLLDLNSSQTSRITGTNGYCCDTDGNNCRYGDNGLSCSAKTVDSHTYTISLCPDTTKLEPVADVKDSLDQFFFDLDGSDPEDPESDAGYFTVSIVPKTGTTIQNLQAQRDIEDANAGNIKLVTVDRGDRYIELGTLVGNGSMSMDIGESDYTPILDAIGETIISKVGTFDLEREPTGEEDMIVAIIHGDNSVTQVPKDDFVVDGKKLSLTDLDFVLTLEPTDRISINYQPFGAE